MSYRGRIAPTPTGDMHAGHARTFVAAWRRARDAGGAVVLRIEDLDPLRCRPEWTAHAIEDLAWLGVTWDEGPVYQSARRAVYADVWRRLRDAGAVYPSTVSRKEVRDAAHAPHEDEEDAEPLFPPALRPPADAGRDAASPAGVVWRFRVPDGETIRFDDAVRGPQAFTAGVDFGDFVVWRKDDVPAYELAVVADDVAMGITEVVRGEDLLRSTARQLLVYRALGAAPPAWCHLPLVRDAAGKRLAKRHQALSVRELRARGHTPAEVLALAGAGP
ncbi:tRNA glutamyl-Q(34) synthetase GluQRS [Roseisolibacter sp. H3M3-2]|uniref:tRNA glutamyl-Q(34) synthetase GluQRS n=1 Tax=Roseisolibacter sp. H3M3-2 TaxID=3031323 RepID=UPI0023DCBB51|nr:tRNA glutamyl-Q(34) synthetase GluQRS [Roseisolibacter sp. H3M3-2]MDF1502958.1 tRNA glutamyl-Q(34) synthetase GluQRS [Roseisolibacter sp. H3M3-2]